MPGLDDLQKLLGSSNLLGDLDQNFQEIKKMIQAGTNDLGNKTIITRFGNAENQKFVTHINIGDEDIENIFPTEPPDENNVYWKRHNELVKTYLDARKQIVLKAIEVTGTAVTGIINPISR